jgi:hypothetical protein
LAGEALTIRPVFADTNFPFTELRAIYVLLELFCFKELAVFAALLIGLDLEVFEAFVLLALVVAFFGIFSLYFQTYTSMTCVKQSNARINRAARIHTTYSAGITMKEMLSPLRLNELLGAVLRLHHGLIFFETTTMNYKEL